MADGDAAVGDGGGLAKQVEEFLWFRGSIAELSHSSDAAGSVAEVC